MFQHSTNHTARRPVTIQVNDRMAWPNELRARAHSAGPSNEQGRQAIWAASNSRMSKQRCQRHHYDDQHQHEQPAGSSSKLSCLGGPAPGGQLIGNEPADVRHRPEEQAKRAKQTSRKQPNEMDQKVPLGQVSRDFFSCMLLGARQSGKRTIVKCFVKLLNEFKLAADEYKKEKMLAKLIDCSEKLQDIANQHQDSASDPACHSSANQTESRRRLNSWLGTNTVNKLLKLPHLSSKRRLNSMVPNMNVTSDNDQSTHQRRHTAIDGSYQLGMGPNRQESQGGQDFLAVPQTMRHNQPFNKSDYDISYETTAREPHESLRMPNQLRVPSLETNPTKSPSMSDTRGSFQSDSSIRRSIQILYPEASARTNRSEPATVQLRSQSIHLARPAQMPMTLRDLNKRRYRIRFKTRRKLSDKYLTSLATDEAAHSNVQHRRIRDPSSFPDIFIIVYSINDRESFEHAKSFISQLRSLKHELPLPIVLVANKIDLERAKVVKSEDGRALARANACKYIETSCTVGFNLDNLLVGLRSQLILKYHAELNTTHEPESHKIKIDQKTREKPSDKVKSSENILLRFYKRCVPDNHGQNYDCDNFSKL